MKKTLYDIFEVSPDASPETIRNAYKSLVQRHHPDKNQGDPHAEEVLKAINFAYGVLSDPMKRLAYDASLAAMRGVQTTATPPDDSAYKHANVRRQGANRDGVSAPEAVVPEMDKTVRVPAQPKSHLAAISLLALLLVAGVLVILLLNGDEQEEISLLIATQPEHKLDIASGNQATPRPVTEISPTPDRQAPKVAYNDNQERADTQAPQQDVPADSRKLPITESLEKAVPAPRPLTDINPAPNQQAPRVAPGNDKARPGIQTPQQNVDATSRKPPVTKPLAKTEVMVAPTPVGKQNNLVAPGAKTPPAPLPNARASAEPSDAKPKDATHPAQQLAGPQVKTSENGKKSTSERGETKQQSIPPDQFSLQAEELPGKAVARKDPMAQYKQGLMYEKGQDLPQDFSQAAHWYRQAAEHGVADAQYHLGKLYTVGKGVPIDNVEAYVWLSLAAAGKVEAAKPVVDYLASAMTPEQLAKAKSKAAAVRARHKR